MADSHKDSTQAQDHLHKVSDALASGAASRVRRLIHNLRPAEIAHVLESIPKDPRIILWELVDADDRGEVLLHVGDEVRSGLIKEMEAGELV
ncbi:MAG TPA: hypothetical protein VK971_02785, partial [Thiohalobacter sp.]|nr:hypothetical protein [Thiohalobacter sp.]